MKKKKSKKQNHNEKTLIWVLAISLGIILVIAGVYFYTQSQLKFDYNGIKFVATNEGTAEAPLIMYRTDTLGISNDGKEEPFGFRTRTKPSILKRVDFENLENFTLMKLNAYSYGEGTFKCEGDGIIAIPNLQRLFEKTGMKFIYDPNATCDIAGRYNYFKIVYGDKTEIREVGNKCYEIVIKGNDDSCEILKGTEKLMVEVYSKYLGF